MQRSSDIPGPHACRRGDKAVLDQVVPLIYSELRRLARYSLSKERPGHTLQPTALVHEAYLRLMGQREVDWQNRAQFLGIAAQAMRRILSQYAVRRGAAKRNEGLAQRAVEIPAAAAPAAHIDLLLMHQALDKLEALDAQQARIVEMRYFGGLTIEETGEVLAVSPATVKREWALARAWLLREIGGSKG